jgi:hypothetical protein
MREDCTRRRSTIAIICLAIGLLVAPFSARAQPPVHSPRVGWLEGSGRTDNEHLYTVFLQGLRELGYVEGQNLVLICRDMEGQPDRLPALTAEWVQLPVDVIMTSARGSLSISDNSCIIPELSKLKSMSIRKEHRYARGKR